MSDLSGDLLGGYNRLQNSPGEIAVPAMMTFVCVRCLEQRGATKLGTTMLHRSHIVTGQGMGARSARFVGYVF